MQTKLFTDENDLMSGICFKKIQESGEIGHGLVITEAGRWCMQSSGTILPFYICLKFSRIKNILKLNKERKKYLVEKLSSELLLLQSYLTFTECFR